MPDDFTRSLGGKASFNDSLNTYGPILAYGYRLHYVIKHCIKVVFKTIPEKFVHQQ